MLYDYNNNIKILKFIWGFGEFQYVKKERVGMAKVSFDYSRANGFIQQHEMDSMKVITQSAKDLLLSKNGAGKEYLGWIGKFYQPLN